jgi:hypothetical protein
LFSFEFASLLKVEKSDELSENGYRANRENQFYIVWFAVRDSQYRDQNCANTLVAHVHLEVEIIDGLAQCIDLHEEV